MSLLHTAIVMYVCFLIIFFVFIFRGEKKENPNEKAVFSSLIAAIALALIPTIVIMGVIFVTTGSTSLLVDFFSLKIDYQQIIVVSISMVVYAFTIDYLFVAIGKRLLGDRGLIVAFASVFRFLCGYIACMICDIGTYDTIKLSLGLVLFWFVLESVFAKKERRDQGMKL
ncbi:hypothetical protein A374_15763 [Fictibacillus macauensis ZFHKF-1]|uniref:Uncharacterized protein n=1 Tax=Fictibacillus macauensis ZFHKF-1 TaxID=1196324 RepID=I8AF50_9BACL|nr:hypothetical protein [Fictibacillus macauensis]EIT84257.1 hypothetical protein A374_15763 [Fictibacillus macauensis ZFHKF-1]